jgi:hypothetical protein
MSTIAFVTDQVAIGKILEHLGLSSAQAEKPPPPEREVLRVAEHADGWGSPQQWDPAWNTHPARPPNPNRADGGASPAGGQSLRHGVAPRERNPPSPSADATRPSAPWCRFGRIGRFRPPQ